MAETYSKQAALNDLINQAERQWITMATFGSDFDNLSEQEARTALGALRVSTSYTGSMLGTEDKMINSYQAALAIIGVPSSR